MNILFVFFFIYGGLSVDYSLVADTLYISGTGSIESSGTQSKGDYSKIKEVIIKNGPTSIEYFAFSQFSLLEKITIPGSIERIVSPFFRCTSLKEIIVNDNPNYVSKDGVLYSSDYKSLIAVTINDIVIDDRVETICDYAFSTFRSYPYSIKLPDSVTTINRDSFNEAYISTFICCSNPKITTLNGFNNGIFDNFIVPKSVNTIQHPCFRSSTITNLTFQDDSSLETLEPNSFDSTKFTNGVIFPDSLKTIGASAFSKSTIPYISLGPNIESIDSTSFTGCKQLNEFIIRNQDNQDTKYHIINNMLMSNSDEILFIVGSQTTITIPSTVTKLGQTILQSQMELTTINIQEGSIFSSTDGVLYQGTTLIAVCGGITSVTVKQGIERINDFACYGCTNLKTFEFSDPTSCTEIKSSAFQLSGIESINLPDSITIIGSTSFSECSNLTNIQISPNSQLKRVESLAFYLSPIESIYLPKTIQYIGYRAFCNTNLTTLTLSEFDSSPSFDEGVFSYTQITTVNIPSKLKEISDSMFVGCQNLSSITFSTDCQLNNISQYAFQNCTNLCSIEIPSGIKMIGLGAFKGCSKLKYVNIEAEAIQAQAFADCISLPSFNFSSSISSVDAGIFMGCINLLDFDIDSQNQIFKPVDNVLFSQDEKTLHLFPPGRKEAFILPSTDNFADNAFAYSSKLQSIAFYSGSQMKTFNASTFLQCTSLTIVQFPPTLETISSNCFSGCVSLKHLSFPSSLKTIEENAFAGCSSLKTIKYCGSEELKETKAFDKYSNIVVNVSPLYTYEKFCSFPVQHTLSYNCEKLREFICTCQANYITQLHYLCFSISLIFS